MQPKHLLDRVVDAANQTGVGCRLLPTFCGVILCREERKKNARVRLCRILYIVRRPNDPHSLTFAMHAPNSNLAQSNRLVTPVHGRRNIFVGCSKGFCKMGSQIDLQLGQPILVVVQSQGNASCIPLLVVVTSNHLGLFRFLARRGRFPFRLA